MFWPTISSVDVHLDVVGDVGRQALDFDLAMNDVEDAALLFDALRLAVRDDRHLHADELVHRDAIEIGVQQFVGDRIELVFRTSTRASPPPGRFSAISVLAPCSVRRMRDRIFGSTAIGFPPSLPPYTTAGMRPLARKRRASFLPLSYVQLRRELLP